MSLNKCYICKTNIFKKTFDICYNCRFNDDLMISKSEVKRKYKITQDELDKEVLFEQNFTVHGNNCTKYVVTEIYNLAEKLTKDLPESDPKKVAFCKQKSILDAIKLKNQVTNDKKKAILTNLKDYIKKYQINLDLGFYDKFIETNINHGLTQSEIINSVLNSIEKQIKANKEKESRGIELEEILLKEMPKKYQNIARRNMRWQDYVQTGNGTAYDCIIELKKGFESRDIIISKFNK